MPFKWYPGARVLTQAFLWRLLDLEEADGRPIDLVIATKFPSYVVRHPNKVVWLVHQFRQAYELDRTELGQFGEIAGGPRRCGARCSGSTASRSARRRGSSRSRATSPTRLERSTGLEAEVLPHPPQELAYRCDGYGDFVLSVDRLDRAKRIDLLLEAAALDPSLRVVVAGDGPDRERLEGLARERGLDGRAAFAGRVGDERARRPLRALPRRLLRAGRRGLRHGAVRGVPVGEAGGDDDGRGRAARDRRRPRDRARRRARAARESPRRCAWLREHRDEARALGPRREGGRRAA